MAEPYIGEIKIFSFSKAPTGWSLCNGAILQVSQNQALFALIGNKFGGSPQTTFALPDLQGRTPLGLALSAPDPTRSAYPTDGLKGGSETVQLNITTVPPHTHRVQGVAANGNSAIPTGGLLASAVSIIGSSSTNFSIYLPAADWTADSTLASGSIAPSGSGQPHNNMQPFLVTNFCIATSNALWPPRQ